MNDWLDAQAKGERDRRLYGIEPGRMTKLQTAGKILGDLVVGLVRWMLALALLAAVALLFLWGLIVIGNDKYILDCPGVVETRERTFTRNDSLHLEVTEYGGVTRLWADNDGSAMSATTSGAFQFLEMKRVGNLFSLKGSGNEPGYYMPLTRVVELRLSDDDWFRGQCTERKPR